MAVLASQSSYSYEHPMNSDKRIIQQITCPSIMVKDKFGVIGTVVRDKNAGTEQTITISITANNFIIDREAPYTFENSSDNLWYTPLWVVWPQETGKQIITISAITDNGLSDKATCEFAVIYFLGLGLQTVNRFTGVVFVLGIIFGIQSFYKKKKQSQSPNQVAG